jgi:hypothetical protein
MDEMKAREDERIYKQPDNRSVAISYPQKENK